MEQNTLDSNFRYSLKNYLLVGCRYLRITISTILKTFEDLVQVELLKVRWEEIKRLQVQPILIS